MPVSYIPAPDAAFDLWADNFASLLTTNPVIYGEDAPSALVVQNAYNSWEAAFLLATNPITRTPVTVADKDAERVNLDAAIRPVAMRINARSSVTNLQRAALGITIRKTTRTPVVAPATAPALVLLSLVPGVATLSIRDSTTPTVKAKPLNVIGAELWTASGPAAIVDPADAALVKTTTKTPNTLSLSPADTGNVITVFSRWATRSGPGGVAQVGPWSSPINFVAP